MRHVIARLVDYWARATGHKIYDSIWIDNGPSKELFCTCGGRVLTAVGNDQFYWTVIETDCIAVRAFTRLFEELRSDFPNAKVKNASSD